MADAEEAGSAHRPKKRPANGPTEQPASGLGRLTELSVRHPRGTLLLAGLVALLALGLAAARLELRTSNLDLIDPDLPEVRRFRDAAAQLGTPNVLTVVLERGEVAGFDTGAANEAADPLGDAVDRLGPALRALPQVRSVVDRSPIAEEALEVMGLDPYFRSEDGELAVLFVQPDDAESRADLLLPFIQGVRRVIADAELDQLGVRAGLTGMPAYAVEDREIIERDITRLSWIGALAVALLLVGAFRSWKRPLAAVATLLWAVTVGLGVAALHPGHLTLLSAFFASILFGLGVDYGIHVLDRAQEEEGRRRRRDRSDDAVTAVTAGALTSAVDALAPALVAGAGTTAGVFFAMQLSGFRGFAELGFIAGAGVLLCLLATVTVLPALIVLQKAPAPRLRHARSRGALPRRLLAAACAIGLLFSFTARAPDFDADYLNLQPVDSEAVRLERQLVERTDLSPVFAIFFADSRGELGDLLWSLADEESVGSVRSVRDLEIGGVLPELDAEQRRSLIAEDGRFAVYAFPAGDVWNTREKERFLGSMRRIDPEVTGMPFLGDLMIERSKRALAITSALAALILLVGVGWSLRRPAAVALAAFPAVATVFSMHGLMRLFGLDYNPLDIMALPVVLGIAADDGVHLVHRFRAEGGDLARTLAGSGRSVLLTSLTTLAAFGCLAFTVHRGLGSFALVLCLGVSSALALSLLLLPELLVRFAPLVLGEAAGSQKRQRTPKDGKMRPQEVSSKRTSTSPSSALGPKAIS